jgi:hypothetical protein
VDIAGGRLERDESIAKGRGGDQKQGQDSTSLHARILLYIRVNRCTLRAGSLPSQFNFHPEMPSFIPAAFAYVIPVFAVAFVLGALRVTLVAPQVGPLLGVALELPVVLALSWVVAGRVLNRWPQPALLPRLALGALAFAVLMLLELATALAFSQTPTQFLTAMTTPPGALGLTGQIGFGLIPLVRQPRG